MVITRLLDAPLLPIGSAIYAAARAVQGRMRLNHAPLFQIEDARSVPRVPREILRLRRVPVQQTECAQLALEHVVRVIMNHGHVPEQIIVYVPPAATV